MNLNKSGLRAVSTCAFFLASAALCLWYLLWFGPACGQLEPWAWPACFGLCTVIFLPPLFPLGEALQALLQGRPEDLGGHLDALAADLEAGGASPEDAQALALEQMGSREALRRSCRAEFRRRLYTPKYRAARLAVPLYFALLIPLSAEYIINTANFGKGWPAMWGCFGLCVLMQGPPLFWWGLYVGGAFEFSGVMVPGYIAFPVHAALLAGALAGTALAKRCGTACGLIEEDTPLFG